MRVGASTFIWVSPFSNATLDLIDKVADFGFDLIEICIEDPSTIDTAAIAKRLETARLQATVCGAFGPDRDLSADDAAKRENGLNYLGRCVDIAAELGSPIVAGPMYSATGKTRLLSKPEREAQWRLSIDSMKRASDHASTRDVKLAVEPLNRFETDLLNTVAQAMDWLDRLGRDNVGLLIDTFHMNIEERNIPNAIRLAGDKAFHFHSCANDRGAPGQGSSALARDRRGVQRNQVCRRHGDRGVHARGSRDRASRLDLAALGRKPGRVGSRWTEVPQDDIQRLISCGQDRPRVSSKKDHANAFHHASRRVPSKEPAPLRRSRSPGSKGRRSPHQGFALRHLRDRLAYLPRQFSGAEPAAHHRPRVRGNGGRCRFRRQSR